jgi:hypothetical protein
MGYLNYLPKFDYTLAGVRTTVADIFRRVAFTQKSRSNPQNYSEHVSEGVETLDQLARNFLNNDEYYWQIAMINNYVSEDEAPDSYREYSSTVNALQGGTSLFFEGFFPSKPYVGDVAYSVTDGDTVNFNSGGVISEYDSLLRKISMEYVFGIGFGDAGTTAAIYGYDDSGSFVEKGKKKIKIKSAISDSAAYFYDSNNRETSPYLIPDGEGGTFTDPLSATPESGTILHSYITGSLPTGFFVKTELQDYRESDLRRRNIKVPPREIADFVSRDAQILLKDGVRGQTTTIQGLTRTGSTTRDLI